MPAEGYAAQERGLAGALEQAIDAADGLSIVDQEGGRGKSISHGAVRRVVAGHVWIQPVAESLVTVRARVRPEMLGNAHGADPRGGPGQWHSLNEFLPFT